MIPKKIKILSSLLVLAGVLPLTGCAALQSDIPPPSIYRIEAKPQQNPIMLDLSDTTIMVVTEPDMPAGLSGKDMILHYDNGRRQDRYAAALWADDLSDLIQRFVTNQARATFPNLVVDNPRSGLASRYKLNIDVLDFQPVYAEQASGIPTLVTRIRFTLTGGEDRALLSDIVLERETKASENNLSVITAGLESQLQDIVTEGLERMAPTIK